MRKRDGLGGALLIKDISTISAMVLAICECEGSPATHANFAVTPLGRSTAIDHTAGDVDLGRKCETFSL